MVNTILDLITTSSESDQICVIYEDENEKKVLTYREFFMTAMKLSKELTEILKLISSKGVFGVYSDSTVNLPVIMHSIWKLNGVFAPLPLKASSNRLISCLQKCGIKYIIVQKCYIEFFKTLVGALYIKRYSLDVIDDYYIVQVNICQVDMENDIVYIVQTSGTTGVSKIIHVPNLCVVPNIIDLRDAFSVQACDVIFVSSAFTFDASIVQMLIALSTGCTMLLTKSDTLRSPSLIYPILQKNKVTVLQCTPSLLRISGKKLLKKCLFCTDSSLRVIALGGERFISKEIILYLIDSNTSIEVFNIYGTSEVSAWASLCKVDHRSLCILVVEKNADWVAIGSPLSLIIVEVRDNEGNVINEGTGQIWLGSKERVCIIDEEVYSCRNKTLVMRPTGDIGLIKNGQIYHCGRMNNIIKRNGQLVSLDAIENHVISVSNVQSCHCSMKMSADDYTEIVLFVSINSMNHKNGVDIIELDILNSILSNLSASHLPNAIKFVSEIPITNHGKVDREMLLNDPSIVHERHQNLNSLTYESLYCETKQYWKYLLNQRGVVEESDNFVQCGGDSFGAIYLANRICAFVLRSQQVLPIEQLFQLILTGTFCDICSFLRKEFSSQVERICKKPVVKTNHEFKRCIEQSNFLSSHQHFKAFGKQGKIIQCSCIPHVNLSNHTIFRNCYQYKIEEQWKYDLKKCIDATPLVVFNNDINDGIVYIGSHSFILAAILFHNGRLLWEVVLGDRIESSASITHQGNFVCVGCYDGMLYIINRFTGQIEWKYSTNDAIKSSPCIDIKDGIIVVGSHDKHVYGFDVMAKKCLWTVYFGSSCFSSPLIHSEVNSVYVGLLSGVITSLDLHSGNIKWTLDLGKPLFSSPCLCSNLLTIGCVDGILYAVSFDGILLWKFTTDAPVFSSPLCIDIKGEEHILIGSNDHYCYCINSKGGELYWKFKADSQVYANVGLFHYTINEIKNIQNVGCKRKNDDTECIKSIENGICQNSTLVCVVSTVGNLFILEASTGQLVCNYCLPGEVYSSPIVVGNKIVIGCRDNFVYKLSLDKIT